LSAATSLPPPSDPAYLRFCRRLVKREFKLGWDSSRYPSSVHSFCPKASARAESRGYYMGWTASDFWSCLSSEYPGSGSEPISSKREFSSFCLHGRPSTRVSTGAPVPDGDYHHPPLPFPFGFGLRVKDIPTVGKTRVIGIPSLNYDVLGPLHRAIYGHLTTRDWLVHGSITPERINKICVGSSQTSVDLVNATDGLRLDVTETILGALLSKSTAIPGGIKELAFTSLYPSLGKGGWVTNGQMMGTYLSFPLLCLHSYCSAMWASRKSGRRGIGVNGDDVVVSHDLPFGEHPDGYEKNVSKTLTSSVTCELNSTVFLRRRGEWCEVRNLRRVGGDSNLKGFRHMAEACQKAGPKWVSAFIRSGLGKRWQLSMEDYGLSTRHRLVWLRALRLRGRGSRVGVPVVPLEDRYRMTDREPTVAEKTAFGIDLFDNGRSIPLVLQKDWSRTQVLKTCSKVGWTTIRSGEAPTLGVCRTRREIRNFAVSDTSPSGRSFLGHLSYEFHRDSPLVPKKSEWLILNPDNPLAPEPRLEEASCQVGDEGRYVLSHGTPDTSRLLARPLLGRLSALCAEGVGDNSG
jgi:hypothetical protein